METRGPAHAPCQLLLARRLGLPHLGDLDDFLGTLDGHAFRVFTPEGVHPHLQLMELRLVPIQRRQRIRKRQQAHRAHRPEENPGFRRERRHLTQIDPRRSALEGQATVTIFFRT